MKQWMKILSSIILITFIAWMAITHEPKTVQAELAQGTVTGTVAAGVVPIQLKTGEEISVTAPGQLPKIVGLKVFLEVTEYHWSGKIRYRIKRWSSN